MSIASSPWIKAKTAADRLGVSVYRIHNLAIAGEIKSRVLPGQTPDFNTADIDRIARESEPATATV